MTPSERGGRTDVEAMAPCCQPHHHLVHEGGWTLANPDRVATRFRPDGEVYATVGTLARTGTAI